MEVISIRIHGKYKKRLDTAAKRECLTTGQYCRKILFEHLGVDLTKLNEKEKKK